MMINIDWNENSTKRGAILVSGFAVGCLFAWFDKDVTKVVLLTQGLAGAFGLLVKDHDTV